jgi:Spy/CpxP family protein refolding chaperone
MLRLTQVLLALSLLLNGFFVAGFVFRSSIVPLAFEAQMPSPSPVASPAPAARPSVLEVVANDVSLDAGQRQALRGVFDQYSTSRRDRSREIQNLREQIVAEYKRSPIDQARAGALIDQLYRLRVDQQKETLRSLAQIEAELKPEQRARMHQILSERLMSRQSGAPGGPGPGPSRPMQ